jgi:hypothetical protein
MALAPVYKREILYRVLEGPMGWMLRDVPVPDWSLALIGRAIRRTRRDFAASLRVEERTPSSSWGSLW